MESMLEELELELEGRHHSGIDDSKNIARCVLSLLNIGFSFT
jgi:ERI1 exoribonuclease 3